MKKVAIFGNAGAGKSTLAKKLSKITGLPLHPLDIIQYQPGGGHLPPEQYQIVHDKIMAQSEWIIDGYGDWETLWRRLAAADTLIYIDLPLYKHFLWITKRFFKGLFVTPIGWPKGSPLIKSTISGYRVLWLCHTKLTPKYRKYTSEVSVSKKVYKLHSNKDIKNFLIEADMTFMK